MKRAFAFDGADDVHAEFNRRVASRSGGKALAIDAGVSPGLITKVRKGGSIGPELAEALGFRVVYQRVDG